MGVSRSLNHMFAHDLKDCSRKPEDHNYRGSSTRDVIRHCRLSDALSDTLSYALMLWSHFAPLKRSLITSALLPVRFPHVDQTRYPK